MCSLSFLRWFTFEKVVDALIAKETYHMNLDQLLVVTRQVCRIDEKEELNAMLNFYHDLGVIVKHGHTVVLQAQWLIDLFKQLITVRPFDEVVSRDGDLRYYTSAPHYFVRGRINVVASFVFTFTSERCNTTQTIMSTSKRPKGFLSYP